MDFQRSSGVLLHPTSLPGGRLGAEAFTFVDWLAEAGQRWWQVLPLAPPDRYGSPYSSRSAFAASPALLADPGAPVSPAELAAFRARNAYWIEDYARFAGRGAVADQVRFEREWAALRAYARGRGVHVIGDVPIFVSRASIDVRTHPALFLRGFVAGAPPDALSASGQLWGNPLYDWPELRRSRYRWWIERFRRMFGIVELARIDHFRGFVASWAVPEGDATAERGRWRRGPGAAFFRAVEAELGRLALVAEDLGVITPPVERLRQQFGLPGMAVLQFAFGGTPRNPHRPENHTEWSVVVTGTHDTDTTLGWWASLGDRRRAATGLDPAEPNWSLIGLALSSRARLAILPAQDVLGLGSEARMNTPGRAEGNWGWRLEPGQLTPALAARLRRETASAGRRVDAGNAAR